MAEPAELEEQRAGSQLKISVLGIKGEGYLDSSSSPVLYVIHDSVALASSWYQ